MHRHTIALYLRLCILRSLGPHCTELFSWMRYGWWHTSQCMRLSLRVTIHSLSHCACTYVSDPVHAQGRISGFSSSIPPTYTTTHIIINTTKTRKQFNPTNQNIFPNPKQH